MTVDLRSRIDEIHPLIETRAFFEKALPARIDALPAQALAGIASLPLRDFCIETEGEAWTLDSNEGRVSLRSGHHGAARVRLSREQLTDVVHDETTPIALLSNQQLDMPEGSLPDFLNWWLVLRSVLEERRIHTAGDVTFGRPIRHSFRPDDSDEAMRAFLEDVGYLHISGFFSKEEMAAVEADFPAAATHYQKGDPRAWFATTKDGVEQLVRMEAFDRYSSVAAELVSGERFQRIGGIPGLDHAPAKAGSRVGALTKPIGVVSGISDVPWHKDCSLGRHSYECCSLTVGISVNGANAESGQLRVVPGSHRALIWPAPCLQPGLDLEPIDLPTRTGDVTVHLSCTQHMSQPPVRSTRKVLYTGFAQRPAQPDAAETNRRRLQAVRSKTHTSISQEPGYLGD